MTELLALDEVRAGYGESIVLEDVSLRIEEGGSLALLGRNGVGKSTLLRTLMGLTSLRSGAIRFRGENIVKLAPHQRAARGLGWVPQERYMFPSLTVNEHLAAVARPGFWTIPEVYRIFPRLRERSANKGTQLSGGEQQMLAIGRALMVNPSLLLLDEPTEGLAPIIVQELMNIVEDLISESGMAVIVVEQHARLALSLTAEAIVLDRGRVVHASPSSELLADRDKLDRLVAVA